MKKFLVVILMITVFISSYTKNHSRKNRKSDHKIKVQKIIIKGDKKLTEQTISIATTSDIHGRIYPYNYAIDSPDNDAGLAKIATVVKKLRKEDPNLILVDNGDTVQDNFIELFNKDKGINPMISALNIIGYDTWTLGNHEFNFNEKLTKKHIRNFKGTVLSSDIIKKNSGKHFVKPYQIFSVNGVRVAVIGLTPPYIPIWEASSPSHYKGLKFEKSIPALKATIKKISGQYDVLIGAFHMSRNGEYGGSGLYDIVKAIPEFNVIFGGHEHARYVEKLKNTTIAEPGFAGWAVSKADIKVKKENGKWVIKNVSVKNIQTKNVKPDKKILQKFKYVDRRSKKAANIVVGKVIKTFIKHPDYITGKAVITTMPTAQLEPNAVIDLINDVQLKYANADVSSAAFFKPAANLIKGPFKIKDVANIYKYANTLMGVKITGKNLLKFMEWSASYYNTWKKGDVTISFNPKIRGYNYDIFGGINYRIDISKKPGHRIVDPTLNGRPISPTKIYKLAVNNYRYGTLMENGWVTSKDKYYDSYAKLQDAGRIRDLIIRYTKEVRHRKLYPIVHNNWKIIGYNLNYPQTKAIYNMIREGKIIIPTSPDGRTLDIKSINIKDYPNIK